MRSASDSRRIQNLSDVDQYRSDLIESHTHQQSIVDQKRIEREQIEREQITIQVKNDLENTIREEIENKYKQQASKQQENTIVRELNFAPEHKQAGISILNFFSRFVEQEYPDIQVGVSITQLGEQIKMTISPPDGNKTVIEKSLAQYGMLVCGEVTPAEIRKNQFHVLELENKLTSAAQEIRFLERALAIESRHNEQLSAHLNNQNTQNIMSLQHLGTSLQINKETLEPALKILGDKTGHYLKSTDRNALIAELQELQQAHPGVLNQMLDILGKGALSGVAGNFLTDLIKRIPPMFLG